jgi:hypothetical protein
MNRKKASMAALVIGALLILVFILFMVGWNPPTQKIALSNITMDVGVQSSNVNYGIIPPSVNYTVKNLNTIEITTVNVSIDGTNHAQTSLIVPPSTSVSTTTFLSDITLSASTNYNIQFIFTFADATTETYSTSYKTP